MARSNSMINMATMTFHNIDPTNKKFSARDISHEVLPQTDYNSISKRNKLLSVLHKPSRTIKRLKLDP